MCMSVCLYLYYMSAVLGEPEESATELELPVVMNHHVAVRN